MLACHTCQKFIPVAPQLLISCLVGPVPDYATGHVQHAASSAYGPKTPPGYDQRPPPGYGQQPPPGYGQQPPPGYDESAHQGYGNVQPPPGHYGMQGLYSFKLWHITNTRPCYIQRMFSAVKKEEKFHLKNLYTSFLMIFSKH